MSRCGQLARPQRRAAAQRDQQQPLRTGRGGRPLPSGPTESNRPVASAEPHCTETIEVRISATAPRALISAPAVSTRPIVIRAPAGPRRGRADGKRRARRRADAGGRGKASERFTEEVPRGRRGLGGGSRLPRRLRRRRRHERRDDRRIDRSELRRLLRRRRNRAVRQGRRRHPQLRPHPRVPRGRLLRRRHKEWPVQGRKPRGHQEVRRRGVGPRRRPDLRGQGPRRQAGAAAEERIPARRAPTR